MVIREASLGEAPIVFRLMVEAFREYDGRLNPPSGTLRETVDDTLSIMRSNGGAIIAWENEVPAGAARYEFRDKYMYIGRVSVHPDHRGKGIAQKMMLYLEELARRHRYFETRIGVRLSIPRNIEFYKRLNYQVIEHEYYPEKTDSWYVMSKTLREREPERVLYVSDLDGTLLNDKQELDRETIETLNRVIDQGLNFTIATARSIDSVGGLIRDLHVKLPIILINGVFIYDMERASNIRSNYLSNSLGSLVVQTYLEAGLNPLVYTTDQSGNSHIYYRGIFNESEANYIGNRLEKGDRRFRLVEDYKACLHENIITVNAIDRPHRLEKAYQAYSANAACVCHFGPDIYTPGYHWLEIADSRATKMEAVLFIKENFHFDRVVCFGDNLNDLPMFDAADERVAVSNAHELVLNRADKIIGSNNEQGVAKYLSTVFASQTRKLLPERRRRSGESLI
jgi:Cof subfamily protein (haloacid dehalogenase superfamily)